MFMEQFDTCQPTPRLRMDGGKGVALAYLETATNAPVDCAEPCVYFFNLSQQLKRLRSRETNSQKTYLHESNKRSHHHCEAFASIEGRCSPLKRIWNSYPTSPNFSQDSKLEIETDNDSLIRSYFLFELL